MQKFSEADGGNPNGSAKDRVGLVAGTTYLAKYWNDNFFNIFNAVESQGYSLIADDLEQLSKAMRGRYVDSFTYNTSAIATQTVNDIVEGSDGFYYEAQADAVTGDNPVGSISGNWRLKGFLPEKTGLKNKIINGNPLVNQRAYISGTPTTVANQYTLDRWRVVTSGQALAFATVENVVTMTIPVGGIEQVIEGLNLQSGTHTISFVATGDTVCEVDTVAKSSGGTFTVTGGINVTVKFSSASGTGTVKLIQVEEGSIATNFEFKDYDDELSRCERYGIAYDNISGAGSFGNGSANATTTTAQIEIPVPKKMRVEPTLTHVGVFNLGDGTTSFGVSAISLLRYSSFSAQLEITSAGLTAYRAYHLLSNSTDARIFLEAEIG